MNARWQCIAILGLGLAFLIVFRASGPTNYQIALMMRCMILMIVTIGLNMLIGHAGLVSLGQAALYGLGAYMAAWLAVKQGVSFLPAVAAGIVVTALAGAILAYPTVRVRGVYLAVITIAFGLIFQNILVEWLSVTGGTQGLIGIPRGTVFGGVLTRPIYFWVVTGCLSVAYVIQYTLLHSRYGRAMRATAQSENAACALGINLAATRTLAFVIAAALAGLAGALYTFLNLFVNFETFTFFHSISFLLMVILGGTGTLLGPIVGTAMLTYLAELLQGLQEWQLFAYGMLLAAVMFLMPQGVVGTAARLWTRVAPKVRGRQAKPWPDCSVALGDIGGGAHASTDVALATEGLTMRFGGLTAVDNVRLTVQSGTVHALIGPNGAGKSSLLNLIAGFYTPTQGHIAFYGVDITGRPSSLLARRGIARTFQHTELFGQMSVLENVLVGFHAHYHSTLAETLMRLPRFGREERAFLAQARDLLTFVGLSEYAEEEARTLPFGHQRRLDIACALALRPHLLLLDEPAAGLTQSEIEDLQTLIRLLADSGITVVLVEHHVEMVMTVSDHVTVLDYGRVIASGTPLEVRANPQVIEAYFGSSAMGLTRPTMAGAVAQQGTGRMTGALLKVENLTVAYGRIEAVCQVDLEVYQGECVGIIGANGAGKTSMLRAITGVQTPTGGSIVFAGQSIVGFPSHAVVARGIAMVPEGRQVFADQTVEDNLILGAYGRIGTDDCGVRDDMEYVLGLFPVLRERLAQPAGLLSGGEQQMLAIARGLLSRPTLLVVDELSLGLAPKIVDRLFEVLTELNSGGLSILLVEQRASYALQVTHRTYVMEHGRILMHGDSAMLADDPRVLDAYLGRQEGH